MLFLLLLVFFSLREFFSTNHSAINFSFEAKFGEQQKRNVFAATLSLKYPEPFANVRVSLLSKLNENTQKECTTLKNTLRVACSWHCFPRRFDKEI